MLTTYDTETDLLRAVEAGALVQSALVASTPCGRDYLHMTLTAAIVDDHDGFRAMVRQILEETGFEVVGEAANGAGAIAEVAALQPDLILLDVQLPDIDGCTVASGLARTSPGVVVVLTSVRDAQDHGQDRVATTPVRRFIAKAELSGATLAELAAGRP